MNVSFPPQNQVEDALLVYLSHSQKAFKPQHVYGPLADKMELTREQRMVSRKDRKNESAWHNVVQQARRRLVDNGFMQPMQIAGREQWALTERGHREAEILVRRPFMRPEDLDL